MCCKTILGARARNLDSRTATNAQHRSKNSFPTIRLLRASCLSPSFATEPPKSGHFTRLRTKITKTSLPEADEAFASYSRPLEPNRAGQRWLGRKPALLAPYESERGWITLGGRRFVDWRLLSAKAANGRRSSASTSGSFRSAAT